MKRMDKMETSEMIERFIQAAQGYEEEIRHGTVRKANRHTATRERIVEELKRRGAEQALLGLFDHPSLIVRVKAATYALYFAPEAAVPVLEDINENGRGLPGADAELALLRWKDEDISRMNLSELLTRFSNSTDGYWQAVQGFEGANEQILAENAKRSTARVHEVVDELERRGAVHELLPLFDDSSPMVRVWAAKHTLHRAPEAAVAVLEEVMRNEDGVPAMEAKAVLHEWRDEERPH
jgi:HEAT repeat protein